MDATTSAVRAMYEEFPYPPAGGAELRANFDVRLLLSHGVLAPPAGRRLRALDAGCGRGLGVLGAAAIQPDIDFLGIDLNRVALDEARGEAARRGLANVRFAEVDLVTLEGLSTPDEGWDVIFSSGVVHHLSDPRAGLQKLGTVLAPHGALALMIYGRRGRAPLYRLAEAMDLLVPRGRPLPERLAALKGLLHEAPLEAVEGGPWKELKSLSDVELVDRYLNVHETSYDIAGLFTLLDGADLRFLRWTEPLDWAVEAVLPPGPRRDLALALPARGQFELIDRLAWRPRLELIVARPENRLRLPPSPAALPDCVLAVNPQAMLQISTRHLHGGLRVEALSYRLRAGGPLSLSAGPVATALLGLRDTQAPFLGRTLLQALVRNGATEEAATAATIELLGRELLYAPHPSSVGVPPSA